MSRTKLTDRNSVKQVIRELTLDEKMNLVGQWTSCTTYEIPDMGIPSIRLVDGVTGVNGMQIVIDHMSDPKNRNLEGGKNRMGASSDMVGMVTGELEELRKDNAENPFILALLERVSTYRGNGKQFVSFPSGINLGAGFNPEMAEKLGVAVGQEMRDSGVDICLGPNVDVMRHPLGGRNYEMYGEDPWHVSEIGVSMIRGIQSVGVAACAKHYIANSQETNRNTVNELIPERALRELYSRGFMRAVQKADIKAVMSAYNYVNGEPSSYSKKFLTDWLRTEWGFTGMVVSDWGAVRKEKERALEAGMNMILNGPNDMSECKKAVEDGILSEEVLDSRVEDILNVIVWLKEQKERSVPEYDQEKLLQISKDVIVDGAVLLKNNGQVLPLKRDARVAFYGKYSKEMFECGSGSTAVETTLHSSLLSAYREKWGQEAQYETMEGADVLVYTAAALSGENGDRDVMGLEKEDRERLPQVLKEAKEKGLRTVIVLNVCGPVEMQDWLEYADSVLCIFVPGCMGGIATIDMLYGDSAPAGKLPVTFPIRVEDTPNYPNFPGDFETAYYGEGIFVGYRYYEKTKRNVQYPFGYGLSYTAFEVSCPEKVFCFDHGENEYFEIPVRIKNVGDREGSEVIQVYATEKNPHILRPEKELVGFRKVFLQPGEEKTIYVRLEKESFRYFDPKLDCWVVPVGEMCLHVGTSSQDIFALCDLTMKGENAYVLCLDSMLGDVMENSKAWTALQQFLEQMGVKLDVHLLQMGRFFPLSNMLPSMLIQANPDSAFVTAKLNELDQMLRAL